VSLKILLSLITRSRSLELIPLSTRVYKFLLVFHSNDVSLSCSGAGNNLRVEGHKMCVIEYFAKSLKVVGNDTLELDMFRPYLYSIVTMSLSRTVSEIFSVK